MTSAYSTDNFTCTTTPQAMLTKRFRQRDLGHVVVQWQSENFPGCRALISLTVDGAIAPGPGDAASPFAMHDTESELSTNGFNFVVRDVPAGLHTVAVNCDCDAGTKLIDERSIRDPAQVRTRGRRPDPAAAHQNRPSYAEGVANAAAPRRFVARGAA